MAEYVTLLGAEQVSHAAASIRAAADTMLRAASNMEGSFNEQQRFLNDWLQRLEIVLAEHRG